MPVRAKTGGQGRVRSGRIGAQVGSGGSPSPPATPPGQVTGLTAGTATSTTMPLTWTAPGSGGTVTDYVVQYALAGSGSWSTFSHSASTTAAQTVTGLTASTSYDFRVAATGLGGQGTFSSTVTASTASVWTPATPGNLFAWYDAGIGVFSDAGTTPISNGGAVQQWNDQSGNSNHLGQATLANRPVYSAAGGVNSKPMVTFTGTSGTVLASPQTINLSGTSTVSVCGIIDFTGATSFNRAAVLLDATDGANDFASTLSAIALMLAGSQIVNFRNNVEAMQSGSNSLGTWYEATSIYDGTNATIYLSNVAGTPAASSGAFGSQIGIALGGIYQGGTVNMMTGNICEAIFYSKALTSTDRTNLRAYILAKYGF